MSKILQQAYTLLDVRFSKIKQHNTDTVVHLTEEIKTKSLDRVRHWSITHT